MTSVCSSSSWVQEDTEDDGDASASVIKFELPATDAELVNQVFDFIDNSDPDVLNHGTMLLNMARKYRFSGYIGAIHFLFAEIETLRKERVDLAEVHALRKEMQVLREDCQVLKNRQRTWLSFLGF